jgi:hypothetical protein
VKDYQAGDESSYSVSPPSHPGEIAVSDSEKAEALADTPETGDSVSTGGRSFGPGGY